MRTTRIHSRRLSLGILPVCALALCACEPDLDTTRDTTPRGTIGAVLYTEGCQRVAYTSEHDEQLAGKRVLVDVSGEKYTATCGVMNAPAPPDSPPQVAALRTSRAPLTAAIDRILPESFLSSLENFLESLVVLYDDGTMEDVINKMASLLDAMARDKDFAPALERVEPRAGYRSAHFASGLAPSVMRYPGLDAMLSTTLDLIGDHGVAVNEFHAVLDATSAELRGATPVASSAAPDRTLRVALDLLLAPTVDNGDGTPRPALLRDWRGMARLGGGVTAPFVDKDGDGLPDVDGGSHFLDGNGKAIVMPSPFAPLAGDGAPRDSLGRLTTSDGKLVHAYVDLDHSLLAAVVRETPTLLDEQKDTLFGLVHGMGALLGPRKANSKAFTDGAGQHFNLPYRGFDTSASALLDLTHAFTQILDDPNGQDVLAIVRTLLTSYEDQTTRVVGAMFDANDRGKKHPEAKIPAASTLYDDLVPIIVRALRVPGLMQDLLDATEDPHVKGLAPMLAAQMLYRDQFTLNQNDQTVSGSFATPVDRSQPDSDYNRSIMQRMAHLIHDANNLEFCNKDHASANVLGLNIGDFGRCQMFRIPDLALFYVLTMADHGVTASQYAHDNRYETTYSKASFREAVVDPLLQFAMPDSGLTDTLLPSSLLVGIDGFTRFPTPQAASRSLFIDAAHQTSFMTHSIDPVVCSDGDRFIDVHNGSIFAWEKRLPNNPGPFPNDSFFDAVRPLITAFAKHDECVSRGTDGGCAKKQNAAKIFVDLMSVLHNHWASTQSTYSGHSFQTTNPGAARYSTGDGVVTYEPLVAEVMGQGDLVPSLLALTPTLNRMTVDGTGATGPARPVLLGSASYLLDPGATPAGVAYRDGHTDARRSDGTPAGRATPYYLMADAFAGKRAALAAADPLRAGSWRSATSALVDQMLTVENVGGKHRLQNRRMRGVILALVDFMRSRLGAHARAGDLDPWVNQTVTQNLTETLSGPAMASAVDFVGKLESHPDALAQIYRLLRFLVDAGNDSQFTTLLVTTADLLQAMLDDKNLVPIGRMAGTAVARDNGVVDAQLKLVDRARKNDPNCPANHGKQCTLVTVMHNLFADPGGKSQLPISDLSDAIGEVHRTQPGAGVKVDYKAADYRAILGNVKTFLTDEARGFLRFVIIVKGRNG